ncbi:hypothetical protein ABIE41_001480 [Bosea sp. OAE506]|uniref:hypothetical protein n=1 Tax=Bosea sp. OAE506 TaxID=2663870 RepID=UPI001789B633
MSANPSEAINATVWQMKAPNEDARGRFGELHLMASSLAIAAAIARLEHVSMMLRTAPEDAATVDHLLRLTGVYWSECASHYEAFKQVNRCEGAA